MSEATKVKASKTTTKTAKAKLATVKVTVPHTSEVKRTELQVMQLEYDEMLAYALGKIAEGVQCDTTDQLALVTDGLSKVAASTVAKSGILDTLRQSGLPHTHLFAPMKSKKEQIPNPNSTCPSQAFYDAMIAAATDGLPIEAQAMLALDKKDEKFEQSGDRKAWGQTAPARLLFTTANRYYWQQQPASVLKDVRNALAKATAEAVPARKGTDRERLIKAAEEGIKISKQVLAKEDLGGQDREPVDTLLAAWNTIKAQCESLKDVPNS
jgi:hypothetical protein